jgi:hypothetical protein
MSRLSALIRRWHEGRLAKRSPTPPRRFAIFDHVPKTGGTALNQALLRILTAKHVAVDRHVDVAAGNFEFADSYPIISGHFGGRWRREFQASHNRLAFTIIRDPVERAASTYSYWRHRVVEPRPGFYLPKVQAAKRLDFSAFLRADLKAIKIDLFNAHYGRLAGGEAYETACEPDKQVAHGSRLTELVDEFDVIGTTERLDESLEAFLVAIGAEPPAGLSRLLARVERNASPPDTKLSITTEDRAFLTEHNKVDLALHELAGLRLTRFRARMGLRQFR